jgi:hypothetical protein
MLLLLFQESKSFFDPETIRTLIGFAAASVPGWLAFYFERRKRKVSTGQAEFDYIKVSQTEIIAVYNQLKEAKTEMMKVERSLHEKGIDLEECMDEKSDCYECKEQLLQLIHRAEDILSKATTYELPELLKHLEDLKLEFNRQRSLNQNEQLTNGERNRPTSKDV